MTAAPRGTETTPAVVPAPDPTAAFRLKLEEVEAAAREWGLRWHQPEGRFISAMLGAMAMLGELLRSGQSSFEHVVHEGRVTAEAEYASAREVSRQADLAVKQARNAQLAAIVQQENGVQRMIKETLPMFAESLKGALVIREARWNRRKARIGYGLSGLVFLAVFAAGFALSTWSDHDRAAENDRCVTSPFASGGHVYCRVDAATAAESAQQP